MVCREWFLTLPEALRPDVGDVVCNQSSVHPAEGGVRASCYRGVAHCSC